MSKEPTDLDDDYNFSRATYYELIGVARNMIPRLAEVCEESEHPRAFEVLFKALKDTADANDKFLELQRRKQVIDKDNGMDHSGARPDEPQAAISFQGSTDELLARLEKLSGDKKLADAQAIDAEFESIEEDDDTMEDDAEA